MVLPPDSDETRAFDRAQDRAEGLARRTSLGVGGRPRWLFEPVDAEACAAVVRLCRANRVPLHVLGGGCNLLVGDGTLDGAVIATRRIKGFEVLADHVALGAGQGFPDLVRKAIELGIPGLPGCPGIPGSVGGVVFMNAGGRFGSVSDALIEVTGVSADGELFRRAIVAGDMGYRSSPFAGSIVTGAVFRRDPAWTAERGAALFRQAMAWKRETQPLSARSAGCMFKNPDRGPSAGRLIDASGLKGTTVGQAMVSTRHANFIVNLGGATAEDVHALIVRVQEVVRAKQGVDLELEVQVWAAR